MTTLKFTKMHGAGNDFIFINALQAQVDITEDLLQRLCHRRFGIGADQLFLVLPPEGDADFRTEIYNSDSSKIEMCGNGIRCFAKYVVDNKLTEKIKVNVETMAGFTRGKRQCASDRGVVSAGGSSSIAGSVVNGG